MSQEQRKCEPTPYAQAKREIDNDNENQVKERVCVKSYDGKCCWWFRSSGYYTYFAAYVDNYDNVNKDRSAYNYGKAYVPSGTKGEEEFILENEYNAVRPAMWIHFD